MSYLTADRHASHGRVPCGVYSKPTTRRKLWAALTDRCANCVCVGASGFNHAVVAHSLFAHMVGTVVSFHEHACILVLD